MTKFEGWCYNLIDNVDRCTLMKRQGYFMLKKEGRRGQTVRASAFLPGLQKYTYERKISVKKTLKRISCLLLALCLLASVVMPAQAAEEKTVVDFVLVLDCSNTMNRYDPEHLAATACKMFIDMIPIQDARVSVITFGYTGGNPLIPQQILPFLFQRKQI